MELKNVIRQSQLKRDDNCLFSLLPEASHCWARALGARSWRDNSYGFFFEDLWGLVSNRVAVGLEAGVVIQDINYHDILSFLA